MTSVDSRLDGAEMIATERQRQIHEEGWTAEHDDNHEGDQLAYAAACYAMPEPLYIEVREAGQVRFVDPWPYRFFQDKRRTPGANYPDAIPENGPARLDLLVKAGALIAAEIDRLQRNKAAPQTEVADTPESVS